MPSPQPPEKNKKVSRACNTCRLKRKKCDGLEPCIFCTETKVECSYSREPRRRGPPSGYLRHTETRVALFETLLGLFIQASGPQTTQKLYEVAQTLKAESTTHTQDVWDAYKQVWSHCDAARAVQELATVFAPFSPADNQTPAQKALLPSAGKQQQPPRSPSPSPATAVFSYTNESFERTHEPVISSPIHDIGLANEHETAIASMTDLGTHDTPLGPALDDLPMPMFLPSPPADSVTPSAYPGAYWRTAALASPSPTFAPLPLPMSPTMAGLTNYLTASLGASAAPTPTPADLPPPHIRAALLATYRAAVHPSLPILSPAQCASLSLDANVTSALSPMLLLALCAYTARLAPPAASPTRVAADLWYESAAALLSSDLRRAAIQTDAVQTLLLLALRDHGRGRDAQAWRGVGAAVRVAQELGLDGDDRMDVGEGNANNRAEGKDRTWERGLWGVASMMDLFLSIQLGHAPASAEALRPLAPLSLSLPALGSNVNALPSPALSFSAPTPTSAATPAPPSTDTGDDDDDDPDAALFAHTRALVRIVARIHFCVGLGYGVPSVSSSAPSGPVTPLPAIGRKSSGTGDSVTDDAHALLAGELVAWHRSLPPRFRVALGGERVPRSVLEAHMLYQVGVGMLARGRDSSAGGSSVSSGFGNGASSSGSGLFSSFSNGARFGTGSYTGTNTAGASADDAASTFNVLLDKYRPSLALASPHVVWLVFAAARASLAKSGSSTGANGGPPQTHGHGSARALQTQLHLLNCREALAGMGGTWELARRCARTLEHLMDDASAGGKRKREDENGGEGARKRRDVEVAGGAFAGWGAGEAFDFDATGWGVELDGLDGMSMDMGMGTSGGAGLWEGAWDEGLWGRSAFGIGTQFGGSGAGFGLGLFDAPPGG
ncbi:hypothetical protein C8R44DRAFT_751803 [Mycena epipterygia]|nr:hypothetical protein C8R44DRAFT_751803 [Mycena epipterygia]